VTSSANDHDLLGRFLALSVDLTAFSEFELQGTGLATDYLAAVRTVVGEKVVTDLLAAHREARSAAGDDQAALERALRHRVLSDERLGPVARNIIKLWYAGAWYELPSEWTEAFGARVADRTFFVSPAAYTEGLLWPAIGANPPGAKAPGFGSWAAPPRIDERYLKGRL
jgi:hypothetical protein